MNQCLKCKASVLPGKFCVECGTKAPASPPSSSRFCGSCGNQEPATANFCTSCGERLITTNQPSNTSVKKSDPPVSSTSSSNASKSFLKSSTTPSSNDSVKSPTPPTKVNGSPSNAPTLRLGALRNSNDPSPTLNPTPPPPKKTTTPVSSPSTTRPGPTTPTTPKSTMPPKPSAPLPPPPKKSTPPISPRSNPSVTGSLGRAAGAAVVNGSGASSSKSFLGSPPPRPSPPTSSNASPSTSSPTSSPSSNPKVPPPLPGPSPRSIKTTSLPEGSTSPRPAGTPAPPPAGSLTPTPPAQPKNKATSGPRPPPGPPPSKRVGNPTSPPKAPISRSNSLRDSRGICSKCGASREHKFCTQCGHQETTFHSFSTPPPPKNCPSCGAEIEAKFCTQCGFNPSLDSPTLPSKDPPPESARRSWKTKYDTLRIGKKSNSSKNLLASPSSEFVSLPMTPKRTRSYTDPNLDARQKVILEIIDTEEDYIEDLQIIINVYLSGMRKDDIATKEELNAIFSNIELLLGVNKQLLDGFKKTSTAQSIAESFISVSDFLKMYGTYCSNQSVSFEVISKLKEKKDKKFETFLQYCALRPDCMGLDFGSYLIKPIQRVCKYPLLLRELINKTDATHKEFEILQKAFEKIEDLVSNINEKKRDSEATQKVVDLSNYLIGAENYQLVTPTRRWIKEGELHHYASNGKLKPGYYFMFNDLFVYTKRRGEKKFQLKAFALLSKSVIRYVATYEKPTFELIFSDEHAVVSKAWPLVCDSEEHKYQLMNDIQKLIEVFST
eukprot:TRINITY_DN2109_c1_g1_i2.p1 TRINITY_DN2109_c1_g1~~TRINITY_DN2109_c1_g1_i2.p1  ORF type:complete len:778 (-),score=215.77 TRINITY_DN2109_c1_g1_i2:139-2472(-)